MIIHQYTSIDSLALILKNKTIKFTRLDKMDDVEEAALSNFGFHLGGYMFVSCWTFNEKESIPLWRMYTPSTKGVRISLGKDMFKKFPISNEDIIKYHITNVGNDQLTSIIHPNKMFTDRYTILNNFWNDEFFYRKIQYIEDTDSIYQSLISQNGLDSEIKFNNVGIFKNKHWEFQDECRFRLLIFPNDNIHIGDEKYGAYVTNCIKNEKYPDIDFYCVDLKDNFFKELIVTLSPYATEADCHIVNALCKEYAPYVQIKQSSLKERVRLK